MLRFPKGPRGTVVMIERPHGRPLAIPLCMARLLERLALSPLVVELLCGVMLGPSVFGMLAPNLFARIFPALGRATQARECGYLTVPNWDCHFLSSWPAWSCSPSVCGSSS